MEFLPAVGWVTLNPTAIFEKGIEHEDVRGRPGG